MKLLSNLQYNENKECLLDLYIPEKITKIFIHIHGGGLNSGDKSEDCYSDIAKHLCNLGYLVAEINYRLYPNCRFPDFINDGASAVKYVFEYVRKLHISAKFYICGHSAGAYIASMLCLNHSYLECLGIKNEMISGWIFDSAQYTTHFNVLSSEGFCEKLQRINEAAPLYYVNEKTFFNKTLLIVYKDDIPCRYEQTQLFYKNIKWINNNIDIRLLILDGGHCSALTDYNEKKQSILVNIIDNFVTN